MVDALLSVKDVAKIYGVSTETIRRWTRLGILGYVQVGNNRLRRTIRYKQAEVEKHMVHKPAEIKLLEWEEAKALDEGAGKTETYLVRDEEWHLKIGVTCDLPRRVASLQSGSPVNIELLASLPGNCEKELHARFKSFRIKGEWFRFDESILEAFQVSKTIRTAALNR